jgi:hypothetical protein
MVLAGERSILTERPPLVGELSANFCGYRGVSWSAQRIPTAVFWFSRGQAYLKFYKIRKVRLKTNDLAVEKASLL